MPERAKSNPDDYIYDGFRPDTQDWQGREQELAQLKAWLSDSAVRLVGIKAAGGFGKSALAKKVAEQLSDHLADRASEQAEGFRGFERTLALTFGRAYSFSLWGRWLMAHFGQRVEDSVSDQRLVQRVVAQLQQLRCLLILDNVETLLTDGRQWQDTGYGEFWVRWLSSAGESVVLVTSREEPDVPNNLMRGCRWWPLAGLADEPGVALLRNLEIMGERQALGEFVGLAAGHPLLLKLAAGWLRAEEPDEPDIKYLKDVDGLNLFEFVGAHRGEPETSVGQILAATLARLPKQMAALLPGLSVYRRPFSRAGAAAMGSEEVTVAALRKLVKRSLLQAKKQQVGDERIWLFEFQPLVQRYLQAQATGEAHQRAIAHYQSIKPPTLSATDEPEATIPYQEIFHHYCELGEYAIALDFIRTQTDEDDRYSSCDMVLQLSGYNAIRLSQYERLTQQWQPDNDEEKRLFSDALKAQGDVLQFLDRRDEAIQNYDQALAIYRQVGDRLGEANTLKAQGLLQADAQQGVAYLQSAQTLYEQIGDFYSQGVNLFYLGQRYAQLQQRDAAIAAFQAAASLGEQIGFAPLVEFAQKAIEEL
ncbi:MAG: NB-ARC domain-containing protein [Phormidesmis sp.]